MNKFLTKEWMGVVLCGGKSRSAVDRGLLKYRDKELVLHTEGILSSVLSNTVVSVNEVQFPLYKKKFQNMELIVDSNRIRGPLAGILSVYSAFRVYNLIVLSCDMVHIQTDLVRELQINFKKDPGYDFYVFSRENLIEPYCGIYTSEGLEKIYNLYNQGTMRNTGIREAILFHKPSIYPLKREYFPYFDVFTERALTA